MRCSGCRLCEIACSLKHEGIIWPEASRIRIFEPIPGIDIPHLCAQCDEYPCVNSCPTEALYVDSTTGAVMVDESRCVLCGKCVVACPGKVPRILPYKKHVLICDLCGGMPECVKICNEAGHGALRIIKGSKAKDYKVFAREPHKVADELAKHVYAGEVPE